MTTVSEKEILEIEMLKAKLSQVFHDTQMDFKKLEADQQRIDADQKMFDKKYEANQKRIDAEQKNRDARLEADKIRFEAEQKSRDEKYDIEVSKKFYEALRIAFYGVAVGAGGTFAIAKTLQLLGFGQVN